MANPAAAIAAARAADFCVALSCYESSSLRDYADVILPLANFAETSGTYVNAEGLWQRFKGAVAPQGEARPGWKILRVLGNLFNLPGFDYLSSEDVRQQLQQQCTDVQLDNRVPVDAPVAEVTPGGGLQRVGEVPIYAVDPLVRHAPALQKTVDAAQNFVSVNSALAQQLDLQEGKKVKVTQQGHSEYAPLKLDERLADGCVWLPAGVSISTQMAETFAPIELEKA